MQNGLTGLEGGKWIVTTEHSKYRFDLDAGTVTREPGIGATVSALDRTWHLMRIVDCTVGSRGYWLMNPVEFGSVSFEHFWQLSTVIQRIEPDTHPSD
jgi:hypothetical protein